MNHNYIASAYDSIVPLWTAQASQLVGACYDVAAPFIDNDYAGIDPFVRFVTAQLFIQCSLATESALLLLREGKEWDADNLLRTISEGSIKYLYMATGTSHDVRSKVYEYWETLPEFARVKRSERAKKLFQDFSINDHPEWQPIHDLIIDDATRDSIYKNYPRTLRKTMDERWSFSGILRYLSQHDEKKFKPLTHLLHNYGMSSHLVHMDGDGVGIVWDRFRREPNRQLAARIAHAGRIISDICTLAKLRLYSLLKMCSQETTCIQEIEKNYKILRTSLERVQELFIKTEYPAGTH